MLLRVLTLLMIFNTLAVCGEKPAPKEKERTASPIMVDSTWLAGHLADKDDGSFIEWSNAPDTPVETTP